MSFISDFINCGYFYQCTNLEALSKLLESNKSIVAYIGFDCTAKSLHVGNLMQIMILRLLQKYGHKPIVVIGGATSKIGDPTGKEEMRKLLNQEELDVNTHGIKKSLEKFINFGNAPSDAVLLNNSYWLEDINYMEFLKNYGSLFSINRMLHIDSVKNRLQSNKFLSFLEFNYMLLQAYDFYYLTKNYDCVLQIGGSDQWGNIVTGIEFSKKLNYKEVYGLTTPLITTCSGIKMGKSTRGAIWINEDMLSPYDYYQYWRNCEDQDTIRFAKLYSEFNYNQMQELQSLAERDINSAKKLLAFSLTKMCHGKDIAELVLRTVINTFEFKTIDSNLPTLFINKKDLIKGIPLYKIVFLTGNYSSKSDSKRLIRGGGVMVNNIKILDENFVINVDLLLKEDIIKLTLGKKRNILITTDSNK